MVFPAEINLLIGNKNYFETALIRTGNISFSPKKRTSIDVFYGGYRRGLTFRIQEAFTIQQLA
jgi:hypothetical protein